MYLALLIALVTSQEGVRLRNQSGAPKAVRELNCVGGGVSCSATSTFGTITVPVGAGVQGAGPIYIDAGSVVCAPASNSSGGCLTSAFQEVAGYKDFKNGGQADDLWQFTASYSRDLITHSVNVSSILYSGIQIGGPIVPLLEDNGLILESRNLNQSLSPGILIRSTHMRDAGSYFRVNTGLPCDRPILDIGPNGDMIIAAAPNVSCGEATDVLERGVITDGTRASGHVLLQSGEGLYLHIRGRLSSAQSGMLLDGGHPAYDGGPYVQMHADGGTYFPYAGSHGNTVVSVPAPGLHGSWLIEFRNPNGIGTDSKLIVDSEGGLNNSHGLTIATFPPCPGYSQDVDYEGTLYHFSYGSGIGTLQYADDTSHWYVCKAGGWKKLKDEDDP